MERWRLDPMKSYSECVRYRLGVGEGVIIRPVREAVAAAGVDSAELQQLDAIAISSVVVGDYMAPRLLEDDTRQPLDHWWWYLGALRSGAYPATVLPPHLCEAYQDAKAA